MNVEVMTSAARQHVPTVVVGGGQAGLSVSYFLKRAGIEHLVLERSRAMHAWHDQRWDSFCLVTPNWQCDLPGYAYTREHGGNDPDGFMKKEEIHGYLAGFLAAVDPPLREGVEVRRVGRAAQGGFEVDTSAGSLHASTVVIAAGNYHEPNVPPAAREIPDEILQLHAMQYRNPASLPEGPVLVVGSAQSGCQIAEDLHLAGRKVHLCTGSAPRVARRYRGKDVVKWLDEMGYYQMSVDAHPLKEGVRRKANHYVTGRDGGRDIDLRAFALGGMQLYGRLLAVHGSTLTFGDDLAHHLDAADATNEGIKRSIDEYIARSGIDAPREPAYVPRWAPRDAPRELDLAQAGVRSVIWAAGYRPRFDRFVHEPVFDERGVPRHRRGVTEVDGLYFVGLPWLHTWGSGRFSGVAQDAEYLVDRIAERAERSRALACSGGHSA